MVFYAVRKLGGVKGGVEERGEVGADLNRGVGERKGKGARHVCGKCELEGL